MAFEAKRRRRGYIKEEEEEEEIDPGIVINNVVLQEVESNEAQLEDPNIQALYNWLKKGNRPEVCDKTLADRYIYWCSFKDLRIFGKNVFRCYDNSEYGVHFQFVVTTVDRPEVLQKNHNDPLSGRSIKRLRN